MTDDTLREECERHLHKTFGAYLERDVTKLMAFARAQHAKALREAARYCFDVDKATHPTDIGYALEAKATAREAQS